MLGELLKAYTDEATKKLYEDGTLSTDEVVALVTPRKANIHHRPMVSKTAAKKRKEKKEKKAVAARIAIVATTSFSSRRAIVRELRALGPKTIDFIVTGTNRGEQLVVSVAKELKIPVLQAHPYTGNDPSNFLRDGRTMKMFNPTIVIGFNEAPDKNFVCEGYQKLAKRKDIPFKMVSK